MTSSFLVSPFPVLPMYILLYLKRNTVIFLCVIFVSLQHPFSQLCRFLEAKCHPVISKVLAPSHLDITQDDFM